MAAKSRPKLSLNVTCAHSRPSLSLRLDTTALDSPTTHNTYRNTFAFSRATTALLASTSAHMPVTTTTDDTPVPSPPSTASSFSDASASPPQTPPPIPYTLAPHIRSILTNSPIAKRYGPRTITVSASSTRTLFSPPKRVGFRSPDVDDVYTIDYTYLRAASPSRESSPTMEHTAGEKRHHASLEPCTSEEESNVDDSCQTPVAGRRKRRRDWTWTLSTMSIDEKIEPSLPSAQATTITVRSTSTSS